MGNLGCQSMKMPINSEEKFREMRGEAWEKEEKAEQQREWKKSSLEASS